MCLQLFCDRDPPKHMLLSVHTCERMPHRCAHTRTQTRSSTRSGHHRHKLSYIRFINATLRTLVAIVVRRPSSVVVVEQRTRGPRGVSHPHPARVRCDNIHYLHASFNEQYVYGPLGAWRVRASVSRPAIHPSLCGGVLVLYIRHPLTTSHELGAHSLS